MEIRWFAAICAVGATLSGCVATPPLMFGDTTTFGVRLGNDAATQGGSVAVGYKAYSLAIVPVSILDDGTPALIKAHGSDQRVDAMSVFASFDGGGASGDSSAVGLGQVFSTGLAAQSLTLGYVCREADDAQCKAAVKRQTEVPEAVPGTARPSAMTARTRADESAAATPSSAYQRPLVFLRSDVYGFNIGGSLAEQGLQFDLGYTNRNIALIPVAVTRADGHAVGVSGSAVLAPASAEDCLADKNTLGCTSDAMSVLGQFKASTATNKLGFGLERYFATGIAARNMGDAMGSAIAKTGGGTQAKVGAAAVAAGR